MVDKANESGQVFDYRDGAGFVEVLFAKSPDEAVGCRNLLEDQNIPARVEDSVVAGRRCGIAVLVPSDRLVEASELLAARPQDDDDFNDDYGDDDGDVDVLERDGDDDYEEDMGDEDDDYDDEDGF